MRFFEEQMSAFDGQSLNIYRWIPDDAHAAVVISHGWSEHAGRYDNVAKWFADKGYEVHALDHRGHGKSKGKRGHVNRWLDYVRDLEQLRLSVTQTDQYLLGHSMGGMISTLHMLEYPGHFKAAALSGPSVDVSYDVPKIKMFLSKALSAWLPSVSFDGEVDPEIVCGNLDIVKAYRHDPFNHGKVSARWFIEFLSSIERVKRDASKIDTPISIWHGEHDALVEPWVSEQFYNRLSVEPRHRELVMGTLHEVLYEKDWEDTAGSMQRWFDRF